MLLYYVSLSNVTDRSRRPCLCQQRQYAPGPAVGRACNRGAGRGADTPLFVVNCDGSYSPATLREVVKLPSSPLRKLRELLQRGKLDDPRVFFKAQAAKKYGVHFPKGAVDRESAPDDDLSLLAKAAGSLQDLTMVAMPRLLTWEQLLPDA